MMMKHSLRTLSVAATAAMLIGCGNAATSAGIPQPTNNKLTMLSGDAAIEDGQMRVKVVDRTGGNGTYKLKALPTTWSQAALRLVSNNVFTGATAGSANRLTGDRTVTLPFASFTPFVTATAYSTDASAANALFTKLRPGQYMFQIALENTATTPATSVAVQTVKVDITGGAITNLVVTLQTTAEGTAAVSITSTGTEVLNSATVSLKNSTAHANANFAFVEGDVVSLDSPLAAGDIKANTQSTTPNGGGTPVNGAAILTGQMSRIVASLRSGSTATVTTNVPQTDEKIVAVWYDSGTEAKTNTAWSTFYGSGADTAGVVPNVSVVGATVTSGLTSASSFTVPGLATTAGPNGDGVPSISLKTAELGTNADINSVLIFRYYDNTFEHRYIASETRTVVLDDDASIRVTVN